MSVHVYLCVLIYVCVRTYIHSYICMHVHIYMCITLFKQNATFFRKECLDSLKQINMIKFSEYRIQAKKCR